VHAFLAPTLLWRRASGFVAQLSDSGRNGAQTRKERDA